MRFWKKKNIVMPNEKSEKEQIRSIIKKTEIKPLKRVLRAYLKGELDSQQFTNVMRLYKNATYMEDLFGTRANATFLEDQAFKNAYNAGSDISVWGRPIRWRIYNLIEFSRIALRLEGDFVECGVDRGGVAMSLLTYHGKQLNKRSFWLFDTFEGLVYEQLNKVEKEVSPFVKESKKGRYPPINEQVCRTFKDFENVKIIKGVVPDSLRKYTGEKVAFLHIDMNVAYPEAEALKFYWRYIPKGGVIVFDDYGFQSHNEQKLAIDRCAQELDTSVILMPTGQGVIIK